jgi:hypothetical protein
LDDEAVLPSFAQVRGLVEANFAAHRDRKTGDIISKEDVRPLFVQLKRMGWAIADEEEILEKLLDANDPLVQMLRTPGGQKFMRKVSGYKLIYDRLDRISHEAGGKRLIHDLARLPDGERYARASTRRGVPDLIDLLPKQGSGRKRRVKDYDKPTERIYTVDGLLKQLETSHAAAVRDQRAEKTRR